MEVVPDDYAAIEDRLRDYVADDVRFVFTTGGTGLTPDDVTPEATRAVIERDAPGFAEAMRAEALRHTPMGILTRGVSGIAGRTLIVNFPGSPKAIDELFPVLAPALRHAAATLEREVGASRAAIELARRSCAATASGPALDGVSVDARRRARRSSCSARTAPASRRCCACSRRCCARTADRRACSATSCRGEGWAVRGRIGLLGHEPLLYRDLTARENLRFHARLHGVARAARVDELLDAGRPEPARRRSASARCSRGMVQRVAVCRAVLHDPDVLLLDEPRANLDPAAARPPRAADRARQRAHARRHEPRPGRRARRGRRRAGPARRARGAAGAARRGRDAEVGELYR